MGGSGETQAQRNERTQAQTIADNTKAIADKEAAALKADQDAEAKKKAAYKKRARGMKGGGREGLMYKGSNVGVPAA